jgi:hypothetical protein
MTGLIRPDSRTLAVFLKCSGESTTPFRVTLFFSSLAGVVRLEELFSVGIYACVLTHRQHNPDEVESAFEDTEAEFAVISILVYPQYHTHRLFWL